jgi:hypothetical protein
MTFYILRELLPSLLLFALVFLASCVAVGIAALGWYMAMRIVGILQERFVSRMQVYHPSGGEG